MGYGDYSHQAHVAFTSSRAATATAEVFKQRDCHPLMNPKGVKLRECRDSADHPQSIGVVFALDVTGSMGAIPDLLARQELPNFMAALGKFGVKDPSILFMAVGDATCDRSSLQVGQFEATAELIDQWLTWSHLEGGGGGQNTESYELALYFLAEHTMMDNWEKRKRRGYAFLTGDELPYPAVSRHIVDHLIGDRLDEDIPTEAIVAAVQAMYEPFFLIPDLGRRARCEERWRALLGDNVICMESHVDTCWVSAGLVALCEGVVPDLNALAVLLGDAGLSKERLGAVIRALTPFASSRKRDGAPVPFVEPSSRVEGKSWWKQLLGI